jgi:DNA-directed RNA polymerase I, II, and III subunit RPABC5
MIIPMRCFTCGNVIGAMWENKDQSGFNDLLKKKNPETDLLYTPQEALNKLGLTRYCCRRMLLTHDDMIKKVNF